LTLTGLYVDFFHLPDHRFGIVIAEPLQGGSLSLLHSSILRGMFRMAIEQHFLGSKKGQHPLQMLHGLNRALSEDPMQQKFGLAWLLLSPDRDQLSFISCGYSQLLQIPEKGHIVRALATPNPALGSDPNVSLLETANNWHAGDRLIFPSYSMISKGEVTEEYRLLSPQHLAEKGLEKVASSQRSAIALGIHRTS
jgi:serine phosphatase RsbU (regulator of sigma subunit)